MTGGQAYNHRARLAGLLRSEGHLIADIARILRVRRDEARSLLARNGRLERDLKKHHP